MIVVITYIRKHQSIYDPSVSDFFSSDHLKMQIDEDFDNKIAKLDVKDVYYEAKKNTLEIERKKE